jgi:hypothetical protein
MSNVGEGFIPSLRHPANDSSENPKPGGDQPRRYGSQKRWRETGSAEFTPGSISAGFGGRHVAIVK